MGSTSGDAKFRLRPQSLVRMLIGVGCFRVILALPVGGSPFGVGFAAPALEWISCSPILLLLALWDWDVEVRHPGIRSLFRGCSHGAFAGSLLPNASLLPFAGMGAVPALAGALAGLALTLLSAIALEWILSDVDIDLPRLSESVVVARLTALLDQIGLGERPPLSTR